MTKGENMFYRVCEGLNDKGKLIPEGEDLYKHLTTKKDAYVSFYKYNEAHKKQFEEKGTIAGIRDVITNKIIFDFDSEDNVSKAQSDAIKTMERLKTHGISSDEIGIYYSGSKGFHLTIITNKTFTPDQSKKIAKSIAGDLETFDSVIYNSNRIIRIPHTKHPKTGLFKTPLTYTELKTLSVEEIKDIAKSEYDVVPQSSINLPIAITDLLTQVVPEELKTAEVATTDLDIAKRPKFLSPWKYALTQGYFPPSTRSDSMMILASTYKYSGFDKTTCYHVLKAAAEMQAARFGESKFDKSELYEKVIGQVYSDNWLGATYSEDNFPDKLKDYLAEQGIPRKGEEDQSQSYIYDISSSFGMFTRYAEDIDKNSISFGIDELDKILKVKAGHLIGLLAPPGAGKTSMALTVLNNMSKQKTPSFFASYDMAAPIMLQKLLMRETRKTEEEIFDAFRNGDKKQIDNFEKILVRNYDNVTFCYKAGQTVDELKYSIIERERALGAEIKLVVVDYLELVRTNSNDPTMASAEAIQGLREIANEGRVVICLLQPNKMSSKPTEPLLSYNSAKGSSAIAQAVTSMITCHRPGMDRTEDDNYFSVNIVKNRMGPLGAVDFSWHGPTGRIKQLEDIERQTLHELREMKKLEKMDDDI